MLERVRKLWGYLRGQPLVSTFDPAELHVLAPQPPDGKGLVISVGTGRCGMRWMTRIFTSHENCNGANERFMDFEALYRFVTWYELPVDMSGFYELLRRSVQRDWQGADLAILGGHYLVFGLREICRELKPTHILYQIRKPEDVVNSLFIKGWYGGAPTRGDRARVPGPQPLLSALTHHSLGRIMPKDGFWDEWVGLTQIGRIAWFYVTVYKFLNEQLQNLEGVSTWFIKLADVNQNYDYYRMLASSFNLRPVIPEKDFLALRGSMPNRARVRRTVNDWSDAERRDFERIMGPFYDQYDAIQTTGLESL
jgi:hypothetical protein